MKKTTQLQTARWAQIFAGTVLAAIAVAQVHAAPAEAPAGPPARAEMTNTAASETSEAGTIPAARPGLPQMPRGAEGPLRTDEPAHKADPSIRDTNPLTINGLWETQPGNIIAPPPRP